MIGRRNTAKMRPTMGGAQACIITTADRWSQVFLGIALVASVNSGCSTLTEVPVLEQSGSTTWTQTGHAYTYSRVALSTPAYEFVVDSVSVEICPAPSRGRILSFGPPLLAAVPNIFLLIPLPKEEGYEDRFFVDLKVHNRSFRTRQVDLSSIRFERRDLQLHMHSACTLEPRCFGYPDGVEQCGKGHATTVDSAGFIVQPESTLVVRCWLSAWRSEIKKLNLSFDRSTFQSELPPLHFRTKRKFFYDPFWIPNHWGD